MVNNNIKKSGDRNPVITPSAIGRVVEMNPGNLRQTRHGTEESPISKHPHAATNLQMGEAFNLAILDSITTVIAVLNRDGVIVAVNQAWRRFAIENGAHPRKQARHTQIGVNYLDICQAGFDDTGEEAREAYEGILMVLEGHLPTFSLDYPCHSNTEQRWFRMSVTPLGDGVVITHNDIS
ncbi:PAS domain-containing protein [Propionivibrio sp.]|uniref:PAS domain-containing protein n=1 Tax=Propionivibrio sp. TaxID=2212460 RepID=UPI003BF074B9